MLDLEAENKQYSYALYSLSAVVAIASLISGNAYFAVLSAILLLLSAVYFNSGHIVNNFLIKHNMVIETYNGYRLSEGLSAAVKRIGNEYFAVSCSVITNPSEGHDGEHIAALIRNADCPFEFSIGLKSVDSGRLLDKLEERRRLKEIQIARGDQKKYDKVNELRRELALIESEMRSVRDGKMLAIAVRLKTFGRSVSEFEAAREAAKNAERIASAFSNALGFEHEILKGEKLLELLEIEREST